MLSLDRFRIEKYKGLFHCYESLARYILLLFRCMKRFSTDLNMLDAAAPHCNTCLSRFHLWSDQKSPYIMIRKSWISQIKMRLGQRQFMKKGKKTILHYDQEILNITADHCASCSQITHEVVSVWIFIIKINFPW